MAKTEVRMAMYIFAQAMEDVYKRQVLSHTTPLSLEPREAFLPFIDQSTVDTSTEEWLDGIKRRLVYERWYAGHFHTVCLLYTSRCV